MHQDIKILIVDDDPAVLFATSRVLRSCNYMVFEASAGGECIKMARQYKPDLILLDVVLPDATGIEICKKIKTDAIFQQTFVVLMSGLRISSAEQAQGLDAGADGYIPRPISNTELKARVDAMVRILMAERARAFEALKKSHNELLIRNQILNYFLIYSNFNALSFIMDLLRDKFESPYGYFGYVSDKGELIIPSGACNIKHKGKKNNWTTLGKKSMKDKAAIIYNGPLDMPGGLSFLQNALVSPLIVGQDLIGQVALMNKPTDFTSEDHHSLESLSAFMAPILKIYMEKESSKKEQELNLRDLTEKNIALNVLIKKWEADKQEIVNVISDSIDKLVLPHLERLSKCSRWEDVATISGIIETHIQKTLHPHGKSFTSVYNRFTPTEIQVADLIKTGKTSKEIAISLNISASSINFHRDNIRKKLGINKSKINLRAILLSIQ